MGPGQTPLQIMELLGSRIRISTAAAQAAVHYCWYQSTDSTPLLRVRLLCCLTECLLLCHELVSATDCYGLSCCYVGANSIIILVRPESQQLSSTFILSRLQVEPGNLVRNIIAIPKKIKKRIILYTCYLMLMKHNLQFFLKVQSITKSK